MRRYDSFYANGAFVRSEGAPAMPMVDPSTGCAIGEVVPSSPGNVNQAVQSARTGFQVWSRSTLEERSEALTRLHAELFKRTDEAVSLLAREMGCPVWLGQLMQVPMALKGLEFARDGIQQITWTEQIGNGRVELVPSGVVAAITPWNFPLHQIVAKVAPAIAAGCSIILKPSEVSPGAAHVFMEAVHFAGLPPGVVNMVWGGPDVGDRLVRHPDVQHVSFTGSTAVGRRIMAAAAEDLKPVTLELGGKSAAVLLEDADLGTALAAVVRLSMANSGQACVSQSRLIAPRGLLEQVEGRLGAALEPWPLGDPLDASTRLGPVASRSQQERVLAMIARAREQGARPVAGAGKVPEKLSHGYYVPPTVFSGVRPDMEIAREEVFGPVLSVMAYDSEDEAVALANATRYGLSGAVWSADPVRAAAFARRMKTGQVVINGAAQNLATPFGGWGWSGFGRENGRFGIEDLLQYRSLHGA
ncbi:aldehyde dehydrogenase family protein [Variovorax sp. VRV01]|uniref:aldehyde dehydrogenase family protein n=1 Tax=Variovorax sp. VRV01 TaxID=2769259 RepID=UPI00177ADDC0|nr:aldehyde dehydrogenase family protein [Variovorax sp. VRV01]MBD9668472.1 aldehyde dehydrogenase family protein [Variovorax sp. VRV01]